MTPDFKGLAYERQECVAGLVSFVIFSLYNITHQEKNFCQFHHGLITLNSMHTPSKPL